MKTHLLIGFNATGGLLASILEGGYLTQTLELGQNVDDIKAISVSLIDYLDEAYARKAASPGDPLVDRNTISQLRDKATNLYKALFGKHTPSFARDSLLAVTLPDELIDLPVELLHDGDDYWSLKYAIVRSIPTSQASSELEISSAFYGFNPAGDPIIQASSEFTKRTIQEAFAQAFPSTPAIRFKHGRVLTISLLIEMIANRDMVILTCHGERGTIQLADSHLSASQISSRRLENLLLFLNNACYSAEFILLMRDSGLRNAHGFQARVPQQGAADFAVELISHIGGGSPLGTALLKARRAMFTQSPGELVWANSVAIGDPAARFRSAALPADVVWSRLSRIQPPVRYAILGAVALMSAFTGFGIAGILQTKQTEANLSARIQGVDEKLDALLAAYKVERGEPELNPESAADFLRNARLAALSGDGPKAREYYRKYFAFGLRYIEPHQDYQRLMLENGERESSQGVYSAKVRRGPILRVSGGTAPGRNGPGTCASGSHRIQS